MNVECNLINIWSLVVFVGPVRRVSLVAIISFTHSRYVYNLNSPASAIFVTKLASSIVSPESDKASLMPIKYKQSNSKYKQSNSKYTHRDSKSTIECMQMLYMYTCTLLFS